MSHSAVPHVTALPSGDVDAQSIGHMLVAQGKLTPEDRERVLDAQRESGDRFGQAALALGLIEESDIQRVLAKQFESPYLEPGIEQYPLELAAVHHPFGPQAEMLRAIRSQLMLSQLRLGGPGLAIVSYNEWDGASSFIANLAIVFSQLQETTLLVDANLRRSRQNRMFNLKGTAGLSDVLAGRAGMESIIRLPDFPNLSLLPGGTPPPNPQELLCRPAFSRLSAGLAERFDVVLYDVATLSESADALVVAAVSGNAMLVAARHKTRLADIALANERLAHVGARLVGSVLIDT